jgi:hypothetical protein
LVIIIPYFAFYGIKLYNFKIMAEIGSAEIAPTFVTLGPDGTDHDTIVQRFIKFQGLQGIAQVELVEDPIGEGPERVLDGHQKFLVLCSAHPRFHIVNEAHYRALAAVDTFQSPTKDMSIIKRSGVEIPRTIALMEATHGYVDMDQLKRDGTSIVPAQSKPVTARMLLDGECDAGLTFTQLALENPDDFEIVERIGEIDTTWTVFGKKAFAQIARKVKGASHIEEKVKGIKQPELYTAEA